jgi:hypothetical protein
MAICPLMAPLPPRMTGPTSSGVSLQPMQCGNQCAWYDADRPAPKNCAIWQIAESLQLLSVRVIQLNPHP